MAMIGNGEFSSGRHTRFSQFLAQRRPCVKIGLSHDLFVYPDDSDKNER